MRLVTPQETWGGDLDSAEEHSTVQPNQIVLVLDGACPGLAGAPCANRISRSSRTLEREAFEDEDGKRLARRMSRA
jgi:hypothetical protein